MSMSGFFKPQDWVDLQTSSANASPKPVDPYLWWLDATDYRALLRDLQRPKEFSFLAEGNSTAFMASLEGSILGGRATVEPIYTCQLPDGKLSKFWTFKFDICDLSNDDIRSSLLVLVRNVHIDRLQMGFPRGPSHDGTQSVGPPMYRVSLPSPLKKLPAKVVIGVIDDGCAFAHDLLRKKTAIAQTRFSVVWNQSKFDKVFQTGSTCLWSRPPHNNYGAVISDTSLNTLMQNPDRSDHDGGPDELACYRDYWGIANRGMRGRESHGASVTTVAAGSLPEKNDAASDAPLIFVDLPLEQVEISSGRWMPINGLDAIRFIVDWARQAFCREAPGEILPVVINLSSGSNAGSHDGSAMLERAMDEILKADVHVAIALAAGNSRLAESHFSCTVMPKSTKDIGVFLSHSKKFETYVEIWLPADWTVADLKMLDFFLESPAQQRTRAVNVAEADFLLKCCDRIAGIHFCSDAVQSTNRSMVLIAIAATSIHPLYPYSPAGNWRIAVNNRHVTKALNIDAWIERDEVVFGARRPQMARFYDDESAGEPQDQWDESAARQVSRDGTLSSIASGQFTFTVAAGTGDAASGFVSSYSGSPILTKPPTLSPAFVAQADRSPAQSGVRVNGNLRGALRHMNGTSVAAPQAARWLANQMAAGKTRTAIETSLPKVVARIHPHTGAVATNDGRKFV